MKLRYFNVFFTLCLLLSMSTAATADVVPGDVIDKTNWQKIEGLVPDSVLNWVKNGDWVLNIGEIDYNPQDFITALNKRMLDTNRGRYVLSDDGEIVDAKTGVMPDFIEGIPFPEIDFSSPQAGAKIMANRQYVWASSTGQMLLELSYNWVNRKGLQRSARAIYYDFPVEGNPDLKDVPNPDKIMKYSLYKFIHPYDISGTAMVCWRYKEAEKRDMVMSYVPSIRRLRRLSPSNRSDGILGSDICNDDALGFDGKVPDFEFKFIKKTEALLPFFSTDIVKLIPVPEGYLVDNNVEQHKFGFEIEGWQGAPWANTSLVWVKRQTYIIEAKAKDPYYNYGIQHFWLDADTGINCFKVIYNRSGEYWKTLFYAAEAWSSADKRVRGYGGSPQMIDDRNQRCTLAGTYRWGRDRWIFHYKESPDIFSMAGFIKFCK